MAKPSILVLGDPKDGSVEKEIYDFLVSKERYADCLIESKTKVGLEGEMADCDLVVMFVEDKSEEQRAQDISVLPHLRPRADKLLLFAENRGMLMDIIDEMEIQAHRVFKLTSKIDWQKRLLEAILDWTASRAEITAVVSEPDLDEKKSSKIKQFLDSYDTALKLAGILCGAIVGVTALVMKLLEKG